MTLRSLPSFVIFAIAASAQAQHSFTQLDADNGDRLLNDAGQVAYQADIIGNGSALYRYQAGTVTTLADASNGLDFIARFPSINASGKVAFKGDQIVGNDFVNGIFVGDGTEPASAMYGEHGLFGSFGLPSLNDAGNVLFRSFSFVATPD